MDIALPANNRCGRPVERALRSITPASWCPSLYRTTDGIPECPIEWIDGRPAEIPLIDIREPDEAEGPLGIHKEARLIPKGTLEEVSESENWDPDARSS